MIAEIGSATVEMSASLPSESMREFKIGVSALSKKVAKGDGGHLTIGWREFVDLPDWGLTKVRAKADTGARSSAIDVALVEELPHNRVRFEVVLDRKDPSSRVSLEAEISRRSRVRSSFGDHHDRLFVKTLLLLAGSTFEIEVGLVSRKNMACRMLLGRRDIEKRFLVDAGRRYLHRKKKKLKKPS